VAVVIALPNRQSHPSGSPATVTPSTRPAGVARAAPTTPKPAAIPPTTADPGVLPQTTAFPPSTGAAFDGEMSALWQGVIAGAVPPARPAFFPESAYLQVKAISDAPADYVSRLVGEFSADLAAAHDLVDTNGSGARLLAVVVPSPYGHWVPPGTCENRVGYFEVPNSRLVYRDGAGQIRSFGIASMISWRGIWYVVHLGAVVRSSGGGVVDDPAVGPGHPAYSSTC
jgi:hypothetical protein